MHWSDMYESDNVGDERAFSGGGFDDGGMRLDIGGIAIVAVVGLLISKSPLEVLGMMMQVSQSIPT